jgi:hypothetical protein
MRSAAIVRYLMIFSLFCGSPLYAGDLAQGHHLWSVQAPNGIRSYVAATDRSSEEGVVALLQQQLQAAAGAKRAVMMGGRTSYSIPPDSRWSALAGEGLPHDLLQEIESELGPLMERANQSRAPSNRPRIGVSGLSLDQVRFFLAAPTDTRLYKKGEISRTERMIDDFANARGGKREILDAALSQQAVQDVLDRARKARAKADPTRIIRKVLLDRRDERSTNDLLMQTFLQGDWPARQALSGRGLAAMFGIEEEAVGDVFPSETERPIGVYADMVTPLLSDAPTLVLLPSASSVLGQKNDLLDELQDRGFVIQAIRLETPRL